MPAPTLKHYKAQPAGLATVTVVPAVPAGRALVISKIVLAASGDAPDIFVGVGTGTNEDGSKIVNGLSLVKGQIYTETNLIALAGEIVSIFFNTSIAATLAVSVYGEEVDN